ncbi:MAG: molybdopterin molybdotransferase MoeA [Desulfosarcinaceae bacterium]|nr:molybdopterin molybdotransferase MoeA [Desulfosarcinaceae bacterium]
MKEFFKLMDLPAVLALTNRFAVTASETVALENALGRVLSAPVAADLDIPGFPRSTMDGFAVAAASTFGASEGNPAYLDVTGTVAMGEETELSVEPGAAAQIATGGMLPAGTDAVVMVEHTDQLDETTIEVYKSVAPGQNMVSRGEDVAAGSEVLSAGTRLRPQELGLLAALGRAVVDVHHRPQVGILSTGDEVVDIRTAPRIGQIRDMNAYTLAGQARRCGADTRNYGIVADDAAALAQRCAAALAECDMVLLSGGSSVGARDFTIEILGALPDTEVLVHGISISPGKPTILARSGTKAVWGLPGHVTSAMVVFAAVVKPFLLHVGGQAMARTPARCLAYLSRNVASAQGREEYLRVRLALRDGELWADPLLGKSGLIRTMVEADGLVAVPKDTEGLESGAVVEVLPL